MGRKIPTHYVVRRPLTLFGTAREVGDVITREEADSLVRVESMVRAGRLDAQYGGIPVAEETPVEEPEETPAEEVKEAPKRTRRTKKDSEDE